MVRQAHQNAETFRYVVADSWSTNAGNINLIPGLKHHYLGAVKSSLEVALSRHDQANQNAGPGQFVKISRLKLQPGTVLTVYIRSTVYYGDADPTKTRRCLIAKANSYSSNSSKGGCKVN